MDTTEILSRVIKFSNSTVDFKERLQQILQFLAQSFKVDECCLYIYHLEEKTLTLNLTNHGPSLKEEKIGLGEGIVGITARKQEPVFISDKHLPHPDPRKKAKDLSNISSLASFPITDGEFLHGVLLLRKQSRGTLSSEDTKILPVVCREIAGTIRNAKLYFDVKKKVDKLTALFEISKAMNTTIELEKLLDLIVATSVQIVGAEGGVLRLIDERNKELVITSQYGKYYYKHRNLSAETWVENSCRTIRTGAPILVTDTQREFVCRDEMRDKVRSYICVPLIFKEKLLGVLSVFEKKANTIKKVNTFDEEDVELLATMGEYMANAIEHAMTFRKVENLVRDKDNVLKESSILYGTSAALMRAVDLEKVLKTVLTAVTIGDGLGFNRAMLFLIDEKAQTLKGMMAVGPDSAEEAGKIWTALSRETRSLPEWLISEEIEKKPKSRINEIIRGVRFSLKETKCPLVRCVRQKRSYNIQKDGLHHDLLNRFQGIEISNAYAIVPIVSKTKALGAILVDNIYNHKRITKQDLRFLSMFASQVGIAIENSILYENLKEAHDEMKRMNEKLVHSEKLAALGEFSARLAHEIRNPLVSIGGYARRLEKKWRREYSKIIIQEVDRLEELLNEILSFSKVGREDFAEEDLNKIIEESLKGFETDLKDHRIKAVTELTTDLPPIVCDRQQIKEVFLKLLTNAVEAMKGGGILTIRSLISYESEQTYLIVELSDTGGGIPLEILHNIFNPFFTTKDSRTGLGLAVTHRIITNHEGLIEVKNSPGTGSTFIIKLPLKK